MAVRSRLCLAENAGCGYVWGGGGAVAQPHGGNAKWGCWKGKDTKPRNPGCTRKGPGGQACNGQANHLREMQGGEYAHAVEKMRKQGPHGLLSNCAIGLLSKWAIEQGAVGGRCSRGNGGGTWSAREIGAQGRERESATGAWRDTMGPHGGSGGHCPGGCVSHHPRLEQPHSLLLQAGGGTGGSPLLPCPPAG